MKDFAPLSQALREWFDKPLAELPAKVRKRVDRDFFPMPWDSLTPDQRRDMAHQWDYKNDPATEAARQAAFDLSAKVSDIQREIGQWELAGTPTAGDLAKKESRLAALKAELESIRNRMKIVRSTRIPKAGKENLSPKQDAPSKPLASAARHWIAFPKALAILTQKHPGASADELAAWIWLGPEQGGLCAYANANELSAPPRFYFDVALHPDGDYLAHMMGCWFDEAELMKFEPAERFILGRALIDRWNPHCGEKAKSFVIAKVRESRLWEMHPIFGGSQATFGNDHAFPAMEDGLYAMSHVRQIESEDFAVLTDDRSPSGGIEDRIRNNARKAANARHDKPGGSRDLRRRMREIWATGKYSTRDLCAEEEGRALGMSFSAARKALRGAPKPPKT